MPSREASLKVTLQPASFQAGLRRMQSMTTSAGRAMGSALKEPISRGLKSAKSEFDSMIGGMKSGIATVATLGGALSFGALAKDALQMQNTYRNIAFNVNKVTGNAESWESIQSMINDSVQRTGRSADDLSEAFMTVFEATGSLDFARKSMDTIGETAAATGHSVGALAATMQLASRKFGVGAEGIEDAMTRMIEKTGVGGKGIEELTSRFALMAGEAAGAGMKGAEGISELLGLLLLLDSSIGEKADPGLKMMFQTVKGGSALFIKLKKEMGRGIKFTADMSAMDKIKATLGTGKGRKAAEQVFTADARVVYDELAKPFDQAMEEALAAGMSKKDAMQAGFEAFDRNLADSAKSTMKYSQIQNEAARRQTDDPMIRMNKAMARISDAFTKPKMIDAMNRLADKMPAFADAVTWALNTMLDNPWETIAVLVGGKIALAFAGSAITSAVATGVKTLFGSMAATQAASAGAAAVGSGATSLGVGGAVGAAGAGGGAAAAGAAVATVAAAVLAAGAVGGAAGTAYYEYGAGGKESEQTEATAMRRADAAVITAGNVTMGSGGSQQQMAEALFELGQAQTHLKNNEAFLVTVMGTLAAMTTEGTASPSEVREQKAAEITEAQEKLKRAMRDMEDNTDSASRALRKLGSAADASRGPMTPADPSPGAAPIRG